MRGNVDPRDTLIRIKRVSIDRDKYHIEAELNEDGRINLFTNRGTKEFIFEGSKTEDAIAIGKLIIHTAELLSKPMEDIIIEK